MFFFVLFLMPRNIALVSLAVIVVTAGYKIYKMKRRQVPESSKLTNTPTVTATATIPLGTWCVAQQQRQQQQQQRKPLVWLVSGKGEWQIMRWLSVLIQELRAEFDMMRCFTSSALARHELKKILCSNVHLQKIVTKRFELTKHLTGRKHHTVCLLLSLSMCSDELVSCFHADASVSWILWRDTRYCGLQHHFPQSFKHIPHTLLTLEGNDAIVQDESGFTICLISPPLAGEKLHWAEDDGLTRLHSPEVLAELMMHLPLYLAKMVLRLATPVRTCCT